MELIVSIRNDYGRITIKPECNVSRLFAKLLKQKTLTVENIETLKEMGYTIKQKEVLL